MRFLKSTETLLESGPMPIRILVVDDFDPWRRFVSATFQKRKDFQVILEVADGPEAVYHGEDLRPDLVLLDIGLPTLNGIKVAQRIREVSPTSKILFLSEENSPDIAEAALAAGGAGYVVKSDAGKELLAAVRAVTEGKRYVSTRLVGQFFFGTLNDDSSERSRRHDLHIYPSDASFLHGFTEFIASSLKGGDAVVVVATETHRRGLSQKLETQGFDLDALTRSASYISTDVYKTLSSIMLYDQPDAARLEDVVSGLVETAGKAATGATRRVVACGEIAPLLCSQGKLDAALRVEEIWDEVSQKYGVNTLCGYLSGTMQADPILQEISSLHSTVISYPLS